MQKDALEGNCPFQDICHIVASKKIEIARWKIDLKISRQIANLMPQIVWTASPDGAWDYVNVQWQKVTGVSVVHDSKWLDCVHPDDRNRVSTLWTQVIQSEFDFESEFRLQCGNGSYRWFLGRARPVYEEEKIVWWVGTATDIDERWRREEMLVTAATRKDEFLAMLAHELRNPLSVVANSIQVLGSLIGDGQGGASEMLEIILRQVAYTTRLVDDLLDLSRIAKGKFVLKNAIFDMREACTRAMELTSQIFTEKRHVVEVSLPDQAIKVNGDCVRLSQVVGNLLHNAAKYTGVHGRISLSLTVDRDQVVVKIKDNGVGIDRRDIFSVFDLFWQANQSLDRAAGGLGIGLTLVKKLVNMHGGSVFVHSDGPGCGSEFLVRIPLAVGDEVVGVSVSRTICRRVLVIDQEVDARNIAMLLKLHGHEVFIANDSRAALGFLKNVKPEYVLVSDGEIAKVIREEDQTVVLIGMSEHGADCKSNDVSFYLAKPLEPKDLFQLIK